MSAKSITTAVSLENHDDALGNHLRAEKDIQEAYERATATNSIPWLHASRIPLDRVKFRPKQKERQVSNFGNECEGMCGV